jgi:hypothetical protein
MEWEPAFTTDVDCNENLMAKVMDDWRGCSLEVVVVEESKTDAMTHASSH